MAEKKYNVKLSAAAGLVDNYSVFNLRKGTVSDSTDAYHNIKIQVFIDGKEYVENSAATFMHAGESSYKEFDGVQPTLQDGDWTVGNYGHALAYKLGQYIQLPDGYTYGPEIWESASQYKSYKNQFKVDFKDEGTLYEGDDTFITYKQEQGTLHNKHYVEHTLDSISGASDSRYMLLNVSIVHFSKYYNIFSSSSVQVPQLAPLIQTTDDLAEYGIGLDANNEPYIANLWGHKNWSGCYSRCADTTKYRNHLYSFDPTSNGYRMKQPYAYLDMSFDDDGHQVSMFKSNYWGADTFRVDVDEWDETFPKGFLVFGIENESEVTTCFQSKNTGGTGESQSAYLQDYSKIFDLPNYLYDFEYKYVQDYDVQRVRKSLVALAFSPDSNGNPHVFNSWFPVSHEGSDDDTEIVRQTILYKSGQGDKRPKTLGTIVVSILANIYRYREDVKASAGYVSDIVYLSPNTTSFVKDVIYKVKSLVTAETSEGGFTTNTNKLLVFNTFDYQDYLNAVKNKATKDVTSPVINYSNVNAKFKDAIKNVPLQFNVPYKEPNTEAINQRDQQVIVKKITGESFQTLRSEIMQSDRLYQLNTDEDGNEVIGYLDPNFTINFIKSIVTNGPDITASWDNSITPIKNQHLSKMFKLESGLMIPATSRVANNYGRYYAIGAYYHGYQDSGVRDLIKEEILIPYAQIL